MYEWDVLPIKIFKKKKKKAYHLHNEAGSNTAYLLHNEVASNTQHIFFHNGIFKDVVAGSSTQPIFFLINPSPLTFAVDEFLVSRSVFFFCFLFCFVWCFLVDKINVRPCISPTSTTRQTPVVTQ